MKLGMKQKSQTEWLIFSLFILQFIIPTITQVFAIPSAVKYVYDIIWFILLLLCIIRARKNYAKDVYVLILWCVLFIVFVLAMYAIQYQSILYLIWGLRNNFRFYIVFLATILLIRKDNAEEYYKILDVVFWINFVLCIFQYFVLGINQDNLGGVFGTLAGCNADLNLFLCIVVAKNLICFMNKQEKTWLVFAICISSLFVAALSELKYFFVEFVIILIITSLITSFSIRKLVVIVGTLVAVILSVSILVRLFPYWTMDRFTISGIIEISSDKRGYTSGHDINRLTGFSVLNNRLDLSMPERIFGLGLGNCDFSDSLTMVTTPFYETYNKLHYTWFSTYWWYLECGYIGVIFFYAFYFMVSLFSFIRMIKAKGKIKMHYQLGVLLGIICVFNAVYNLEMRRESAYIIYVLMAIPFRNVIRIKSTENEILT